MDNEHNKRVGRAYGKLDRALIGLVVIEAVFVVNKSTLSFLSVNLTESYC